MLGFLFTHTMMGSKGEMFCLCMPLNEEKIESEQLEMAGSIKQTTNVYFSHMHLPTAEYRPTTCSLPHISFFSPVVFLLDSPYDHFGSNQTKAPCISLTERLVDHANAHIFASFCTYTNGYDSITGKWFSHRTDNVL